VSEEEQERIFQDRLKDPAKRWKLSPMDLESRSRRKYVRRLREEQNFVPAWYK
jgi:polyphosphate kinase 2 (PPK2 family)